MKVQELRIENYVKYNGSIVSVYAISNPTPNKDKHFDNKARVTLWCNGLIDATIDEIEPILITEELLLKNGFELTDKPIVKTDLRLQPHFVYRKTVDNVTIDVDPVQVFIHQKRGTMLNIQGLKHLHQLQNAFYLATSTELSIKL